MQRLFCLASLSCWVFAAGCAESAPVAELGEESAAAMQMAPLELWLAVERGPELVQILNGVGGRFAALLSRSAESFVDILDAISDEQLLKLNPANRSEIWFKWRSQVRPFPSFSALRNFVDQQWAQAFADVQADMRLIRADGMQALAKEGFIASRWQSAGDRAQTLGGLMLGSWAEDPGLADFAAPVAVFMRQTLYEPSGAKGLEGSHALKFRRDVANNVEIASGEPAELSTNINVLTLIFGRYLYWRLLVDHLYMRPTSLQDALDHFGRLPLSELEPRLKAAKKRLEQDEIAARPSGW